MASSQADFFLSPDQRRDFALVVEGKNVYVDRYYLTAWSSVFQKIFYPEGLEQPKSGMQMNGKKLEGFLEFLRYICPTRTYSKKITESNVVALLAYADEYDVAVMRDHCVAYLTKRLDKEAMAGDTLIDYLRLAAHYRLVDLQTRLIPLVARLFLDQIKAAHTVLSAPVLAAVYQARALQFQHSGGHHDADCTGELPKDAFKCYTCREPCAISAGKSACCSNWVWMPEAVAKVQSMCTFVCRACNKPCALKPKDYYQWSTCCSENFAIYHKCEACEQKTTGDAPAAKRHCVDLLDLLDKKG